MTESDGNKKISWIVDFRLGVFLLDITLTLGVAGPVRTGHALFLKRRHNGTRKCHPNPCGFVSA